MLRDCSLAQDPGRGPLKPADERDYLYVCGRIRFLEGHLLNREGANRMIDARTVEDAFRLLSDFGYETPAAFSYEELERLLSQERCRVFDTLAGSIPDSEIMAFFRSRYDLHNIKVLLKTPQGQPVPDTMLMKGGIYGPEALRSIMGESDFRKLPKRLAQAIQDALDSLSRTHDSQLAEIILDKGHLDWMLIMARQIQNPFIIGYVQLLMDTLNLRTLVRGTAMGRSPAFMETALIAGGTVPVKAYLGGSSALPLESLFSSSPLKNAALLAAAALKGHPTVIDLEKQCENELNGYLIPARRLAFGPPVVFAYLAAKESEIKALRCILTGRLSGIAPEILRERIRDHYV